MVSGSLGRSITLKWNMLKESDTDTFFTASLVLAGTAQRILYILDTITQKPVDAGAGNIFGKRIKADIIEGKSYVITLQHLNYRDSNSFGLIAQVRRGDFTSSIKKSTIQLLVKGMEHLISIYSCS